MPNGRIVALTKVLEEAGVDAYFAWSPITMGYLHDLFEDAHERFLALAIARDGHVRLIAPALSETQARRVGVEDIRPWKDGENPLAHVEQLATDWNLWSGVIAVDDEMPARMILELQNVLPAALFRPGGSLAAQLMRRKSDEEIQILKDAGQIADEAWEVVRPQIKAGLTEKHVSKMLYVEMEKRGGEPTFAIIAAGPNGAEPHHLSDDTVLTEGDVVICDFGCSYKGYESDITRTIAIGHASDEAKKVYEIVFAAHQAGRAAINAGVTAGSVDGAARKVIDDAGYGPLFFHRLGHGIGMRGHEEPYIIGGSEVILVPGDAFSIEPGIYLPGKFGVRIENIVVATEGGHQSMNAEPSPELIIV